MKEIVLRAIVTQCALLDAKLQKAARSSSVEKDQKQLLQKELRQDRRRLERLQEQKMRLYENYTTGEIGRESYMQQKRALTEEEGPLKARLRLTERKVKELEEREKETKKQSDSAKQILPFRDITELTPELTKELIKRIAVFPDGGIQIEWNFRNELASLMDESGVKEKNIKNVLSHIDNTHERQSHFAGWQAGGRDHSRPCFGSPDRLRHFY